MFRRGEENRRETPYFSVCCFPCRFAETSLKPTYRNVDLCKPQTRRTSGETAGRSWTGYRASGRRSGRSGGRGREEECFHASREIPRSQPLPPRAETYADLRPCPSKKTKSKKANKRQSLPQTREPQNSRPSGSIGPLNAFSNQRSSFQVSESAAQSFRAQRTGKEKNQTKTNTTTREPEVSVKKAWRRAVRYVIRSAPATTRSDWLVGGWVSYAP